MLLLEKLRIKEMVYFIKMLKKKPFYYFKGNKVPWSSFIASRTIINRSIIGSYCYVGPGVIMNNVHLGNYCSIAPYVQIGGTEHSWWWGSTSLRISDFGFDNLITVIEDDVWIAANAVIKQGIHIGRGSVIGAGAVVVKNVDPYSIVAGVPAKVLRKRFNNQTIQEVEKTEFWKYKPKMASKLLSEIKYTE